MAENNVAGASVGVVGAPEPGSPISYQSILEGAGPDKIVAVYNPLSQDFRVQYSRQLVAPLNVSPGSQIARERAGLDLSKEQGVQGHSVQWHILKAKETENLPGDIAQIAVRQLRNWILTSGGDKKHKLTADPHAQMEVEQQIVKSVMDSTAFFNQQQTVMAPPAPDPSSPSPDEFDTAKSNADANITDPAPGTGFNYDPATGTKTT